MMWSNSMSRTLFAILITFFTSFNVLDGNQEVMCDNMCTSGDCLKHAFVMLSNMKTSVDPCKDFYNFACGAYVEKFGKNDVKTVYDDTWNSLQVQIKDLLDNLHFTPGTFTEKMKVSYEACMNIESAELSGISNALDFLSNLGISRWPNLSANFSFENPDLSKVLGILASHHEFSFLSFKESQYRSANNESSSSSIALILPDSGLLNTKLNPKDIESTVLKILEYFSIDRATSLNIWQEFKTVEYVIMKLQNEEAAHSSKCKNGPRRVFAEVNCTEEQEDSFRFLCRFWKWVVKSGHLEEHFAENTFHISCRWNHDYFVENIFFQLNNMTKRSISNYLALRFFIAHLDDMNLYFQLVKKAHSGVKSSKQRNEDTITRWEYCVAWIIKSMNLALGHEYLKRYFEEHKVLQIQNTIQEYINELGTQIEQQSWIDGKVKNYLKIQLEKLEIGFENSMQIYQNRTFIESYYKEFHPIEENFLKNILEFQKFSTILDKKGKTNFNGFFSSSDPYLMDFGFALFLSPTYSYGLPKLWNYAALGWIIGHELSHNFKFALDLVSLDDKTERNLEYKLQCYFEQYSKLLTNKFKLKSEESKEEIMADNIGWSLNEKIVEKSLKILDHNFILPALQYSQEELMFINFAQASCEAISKEVEQEFYSTKPHNIEKLRVLAVLQNSKIFSEVFNCSSNVKMNPESKCIFFD